MRLTSAKQSKKRTNATNELVIILIFSAVVFAIALIFDIFEKLDEFCAQFKYLRLDEILVVLMLLGFAFGIFSMRRWRELKQEVAERIKAEEALQQYAQRLKNLNEIEQAILAVQSPTAIAEKAVRQLQQFIPFQWANVVVFNQDNRHAMALVSYLKGEIVFRAEKEIPIDKLGFSKEVSLGELVVENDVKQMSGKLPYGVQALVQQGLRAYIIIPLLYENQLIGILNLGADKSGAFEPDFIQIAHEVAAPLAVAIQNARLFEQVRAAQERSQLLSQLLVEAQETERRRIARELHDEVGQALTAVKINLQASRRKSGADTTNQLEDSIYIVEQTLQQVRNIALDLRPSLLDDLGLAVALRWYVERVAQRVGLVPEIITDLNTVRFPPHLETTCFRLTQEVLTNIVRHAQAQHVRLELRLCQPEILELIISDDGVGFNVATTLEQANQGVSLGLLGMQERLLIAGGSFEITSQPGQGSQILVRLPITASLSNKTLEAVKL